MGAERKMRRPSKEHRTYLTSNSVVGKPSAGRLTVPPPSFATDGSGLVQQEFSWYSQIPSAGAMKEGGAERDCL